MRYMIIVAALCLVSCSSNDPYRKLNKLSGLWQTDTGEGILYEEWTKSSNNVMFGKSYMINGTDSMVFERIRLMKSDSGVYYIPTVKDQNQSKPIPFKLIEVKEKSFTFENKLHDFPQRVLYRFVNNDSIVARIEGDVKGVTRFQEFYYSRVKK